MAPTHKKIKSKGTQATLAENLITHVATFATQNSLFFSQFFFKIFHIIFTSFFFSSSKNINQKTSGASPINKGPGDVTWDEGAPTFDAPTSHMRNKFTESIFDDPIT